MDEKSVKPWRKGKGSSIIRKWVTKAKKANMAYKYQNLVKINLKN